MAQACLTKRASIVALLTTDQHCLLRSGLCSQPPYRLSEGTTLAGAYLVFYFACVCFFIYQEFMENHEKRRRLWNNGLKREKRRCQTAGWMREVMTSWCSALSGRVPLPGWPFLSLPMEVGPCHQGVPERQEGRMQTGKWAWRLQPRASPRMRRPALGNLGPDDKRTSWPGSNIFGS